MKHILPLLTAGLLVAAGAATAQVPETLSYQGRVTVAGTNYTGSGQFKFALVSASTNAARPATAMPTVSGGFVTIITITDPGVGYGPAPAVTITDATGSGATALATVVDGSITAITVQTPGSGYSAAASVTIAPPPPSPVAQTYWSNDGTSTDGSEPTAAVPVPVADGLVAVFLGDTNLANMSPLNGQVFTHADARLRLWFSDGVNPFACLTPDQPLGAVGYAQMAAQVAPQAIGEANLANSAVTALKLAPNAVASASLANNSVTSPKIADGAVTTADIADGTITAADLATSSVTSAAIADGAIVNADLSLSANIADTKLATIATTGKVANAATTATAANTPNAIVTRDAIGNFAAGTVTATALAGNGAALTSLTATQLTTGTVPDARLAGNIARTNQVWLLGGNAGTTPGTDFLGTTGNQPLELKVNHLRALRLESSGDSGSDTGTTPDGAPNVIGGSPANFVAAGVVGVTISGGGATNWNGSAAPNSVAADYATIGGGGANTIQISANHATIGGGYSNLILTNANYAAIGGGNLNTIQPYADYATIGGGNNNTIQPYAFYATIGGGDSNTIQTNANTATIGGGYANTIQAYADYATIGGGYVNLILTNADYAAIGGGGQNEIQTNATYTTISGGFSNTIQTNANYATIGGGCYNTIQTNATFATIPGGYDNSAANYAFAAGRRAKANHTGAFVWGDAYNADIASTNANSVTMRASGGYRLFANIGATVGASLAAGSGSWTSMSDRNVKEAFQPVNAQEVLAKVAALPLTTWNYKSQAADIRHIGPMAQDFKAAFAVGETDTGITTIDADGVALAAIQGLNQKVEAENAALKQELAELKAMVHQLVAQPKQPKP